MFLQVLSVRESKGVQYVTLGRHPTVEEPTTPQTPAIERATSEDIERWPKQHI